MMRTELEYAAINSACGNDVAGDLQDIVGKVLGDGERYVLRLSQLSGCVHAASCENNTIILYYYDIDTGGTKSYELRSF